LPACHRVVRLPHATTLAWFQHLWVQLDGITDRRTVASLVAGELGENADVLTAFFFAVTELGIPVPPDAGTLLGYLEKLCVDIDVRYRRGVLQFQYGDAWDGESSSFVEPLPRADCPEPLLYPLRTGELPTVVADDAFAVPADLATALGLEAPTGRRLFMVFTSPPEVFVIDGIRLPELPLWLLAQEDLAEQAFPLQLLRAVMAADDNELPSLVARVNRLPVCWWRVDGISLDAENLASVNRVARALLRRQKLQPRTKHARRLLAQVEQLLPTIRETLRSPRELQLEHSPHMLRVQLQLRGGDAPAYGQWLMFDDRWAAGSPALARSILGWGAGWDWLASCRVPPQPFTDFGQISDIPMLLAATAFFEDRLRAGDTEAVIRFLDADTDGGTAAAAWCLVVLADDDDLRESAVAVLLEALTQRRLRHPRMPTLLLGLVQHKDAVDYLIAELAVAEGRQASMVSGALRAGTGQQHAAAADWRAWWQAEREQFVFPGASYESRVRQWSAQAQVSVVEGVTSGLRAAGAGTALGRSMDAVGEAIGAPAAAVAALDLPAAAEPGLAAFRAGDYATAAARYEGAAADSGNRHCRYMQGLVGGGGRACAGCSAVH
jgi:hypothetical protein